LGFDAPTALAIARNGHVTLFDDDGESRWDNIDEVASLLRVPSEELPQWPTLSERHKAEAEHQWQIILRNREIRESGIALSSQHECESVDIYPREDDPPHVHARKAILAYEVDPEVARALYPELDF